MQWTRPAPGFMLLGFSMGQESVPAVHVSTSTVLGSGVAVEIDISSTTTYPAFRPFA